MMREHGAPPTEAVDLFCGAGGLSYGMQRAGVRINAGIDIDAACRHPFEANVKASFHQHDVSVLDPDFVAGLFTGASARVLAGCVPCQPFSSYSNASRSRESEWELLSKFGTIISAVLPEVVTMENVPRLRDRPVFKRFVALLDHAGYKCSHAVVGCAKYGVPQTRRRLVLLASKQGAIEFDPPTHEATQYVTAAQAIGHLEPIHAGDTAVHDPMHKSSHLSERNLERIRQSKPGGTWRDWSVDLRADCHLRGSGRDISRGVWPDAMG